MDEVLTPITDVELEQLRQEITRLEQRYQQLVEAHHAGHENTLGRFDEQRRRMDTLSASHQDLHERLLDLTAHVRRLERAEQESFSGPSSTP